MSTIDAAIIKALVEHIGMDPDSIPSGDGSTSGSTVDETWDNVDWSSMESNSDIFIPTKITIDGTEYVGLQVNKGNDASIAIGTRMYIAQKDGTLHQMILVNNDNDVRVFTGQTISYGSEGGRHVSDGTIAFNEYHDTVNNVIVYYCNWLKSDKVDVDSIKINADVRFTIFTLQSLFKYITGKLTV